MNIENDVKLTIYVANSRKDLKWVLRKLKYSEFLEILKNTKRTRETVDEFKDLSLLEKGEIKDVGGFVGGKLKDNIRRKNSIQDRCLITLDADYCDEYFLGNVDNSLDFAYVIYSTHSHRKGNERYRIVIPLSSPISIEDYTKVSRYIAEIINKDYFDKTTFEPSRLMYWPSTSKDGDYVFIYKDRKILDSDEIIKKASEWRNNNFFERKENILKTDTNKKSVEKTGIIGAFLKTYNIHTAIEKFLKDVYTKVDVDRYTFNNGSSYGGAVVYQNGKFLYSNHATDPVGGKLVNAFDLVRIHKFSLLDRYILESDKVSDKPSFKAMLDLCNSDDKLADFLIKENVAREFQEEPMTWISKLKINKKGQILGIIKNIVIIMENDKNLKGKIGFDMFTNSIVIIGKLPWDHDFKESREWCENDDNNLISYIEEVYEIDNQTKVIQALGIASEKNKFHPIIEYLAGYNWDGNPRLEKVFIDYLGAKNTKYVREVTRKIFIAAVARVYEPGIKFDNMLILIGNQGIGKSKILEKLGGSWYSDSIVTVQGKEAFEQLQNAWIAEFSELSAFKRVDMEVVKHFIAKCIDNYRPAYARRVLKIKRQCVFFGTTNKKNFLKDETGNRRFWPVEVTGIGEKNIWSDLTEKEIGQIWAEAVYYYKLGEDLFIKEEVKNLAEKMQLRYSSKKIRRDLIKEYLEMYIPRDWDKYTIEERIQYINNEDYENLGEVKRAKVCGLEIWVELFREKREDYNASVAKEITTIIKTIENFEEYEANRGRLRIDDIYGTQKAFVRKRDFYS